MPLDVGYFMTENAGDFGSCFGLFDQPGEKENRSSRNRKGIELGVLDDKKAVIEGLRPHGGQYALPNPVDITLNLRVGDEFELLSRLTPKFAADSSFFVFARSTYGRKNVFCNLRAGAAATYQKPYQNQTATRMPRTKATAHSRIIVSGPLGINSARICGHSPVDD